MNGSPSVKVCTLNFKYPQAEIYFVCPLHIWVPIGRFDYMDRFIPSVS